MTFENLDGEQESSHHKAETYRRRVRDYLEAGEYLEVGDGYAGTSDIVLSRPAHAEDKKFRVETKNTKLSLFDDGFIDELARQFIDFARSESPDFEFMVFADDYASQSRWKDIFHDRIRKEDEVRAYYEELDERHNLNEAETDQFESLDFRDFWRFLERVSIKKVGYGRLGELIEDRESQNRGDKKWDFYTRENEPVKERGNPTPNFVRIVDLPDEIWTLQSLAPEYHDVYDQNPRYLPIWFQSGQMYSLIPPGEMPDSLVQFVNTDTSECHDFMEWMSQTGDQHNRRVIALLNRQVLWRGVRRHDRCVSIRHRGQHKLIIQRDIGVSQDTDETRQQELSGTLRPSEENDSEANQEFKGYVALKDWGTAYAHRYGMPVVKQYGDQYYVFVETGWLFTERGRGDSFISGDRADELHHQLDKNSLSRNPNQKSQFRQWRAYLGLDEGRGGHASIPGTGGQRMTFEDAIDVHPRERPPKNTEERDALMAGEAVVKR
ncbi:hypothetical protein PN417_14775 [Halorubrum ezzemoulense]|uniref:hypothetical protein n=1 Tax=Halorubrum ezzemoulense TaxID=337243 RepID=UPI00232B2602|nr:hypothetical protein [Halorubrum ezzemoulense]MDB9302194.1 hypothetical protein [Halorubrum ezzemoulense]